MTIDKITILDIMKQKGIKLPDNNSLEYFRLIIGIWTDKTDSINTELYSLRIHEATLNSFDLDIIEINTDQKVICKPIKLYAKQYRCLFMVTYEEQDVAQNNDLLVYASSTNKADTTEMYGNFIYANIYNEFNEGNLKQSIPSYEQTEYNTEKNGNNYFYIKLGTKPYHKGQYLYVSVITSTPDDIIILTSLNNYNRIKESIPIFYPNSHGEQLIQVLNDLVQLEFAGDTSLYITIESLGGEAELYWEDDNNNVHNLKEKEENLILITQKNNLKKLNIRKIKSDNEQMDMEPGFVFIIKYYKRNTNQNFDEIIFGSSVEIGYRETDLPINLYSKTVDISNDINLVVSFKDSPLTNSEEGEYEKSPLEILSYLDKRDNIYSAKAILYYEPPINNRKYGIYDPAINVGQISISTEEISNNFNIEIEDNPTILLSIIKSQKYNNIIYNTFNL